MKNILTFDIEEYFQVENFKQAIDSAEWETFESRVEYGTDIILRILADYRVKVTFFVLGWTAERHPELIKKISDEGHEIGSHGYKHELIYNESPQEFRADLERSLKILRDITGKKIVSYRAPSFSITRDSLWALDVLRECGIRNDSSIFPILHDRYGIPDADRYPHIIRRGEEGFLKEFPISTFEFMGRRIPFSGGGYFRLLPRFLIVKMAKRLNTLGIPLVIYLHPWEFDTEQPRVRTSALNSFRHYLNIHKTEEKLRHLLDSIDVGPLHEFHIQPFGKPAYIHEVCDEKTASDLSIVIPVYNEVESVELLIKRVTEEADKLDQTYEILLVDDGSLDGTADTIRAVQKTNPKVRLIRLKRNYGQTPAMVAGFDAAVGKIIITLDGDLQNDPADIAKLLDKIEEGYDIVSGWRYHRKDKYLTRTLPSMIANNLISRVTGVHLHDYGCSLKAYRAGVIQSINAYGEMHRFFPAVASVTGAKTAEVIVSHHARRFGTSKYGLDRTFKVLADLITMHMITRFSARPVALFGIFSFIFFVSGIFFTGCCLVDYIISQTCGMVQAAMAIFSLFLSLHFIMAGLACMLVVSKSKFKTRSLSLETAQVF